MSDPAKLGGLYSPPGMNQGPSWPTNEHNRPVWCKCGRSVYCWRMKRMDPYTGSECDGDLYYAGTCGECGEREARDRQKSRELSAGAQENPRKRWGAQP